MKKATSILFSLALAFAATAQAPKPQAQQPKAYTITLPVEAWDFLIGTLDSVSIPFRLWAPIRQELFRQAGEQNKPKEAQKDSTAVEKPVPDKPKKQ